MRRTIDIQSQRRQLNPWVQKSITLFLNTSYLDAIQVVYPFGSASPERINNRDRRELILAHTSRNIEQLFQLLKQYNKFPYDDPVWYMLKNIKDCFERNPQQSRRIAETLFNMTAEETVVRLESAPKINTQVGPMFTQWLRKTFKRLPREAFIQSTEGICILDCSEEEGKRFVQETLNQDISKRPDLIAKSGTQYIIGEAKWVGQPGGNQTKNVEEVLAFCNLQRGDIRRIGIIDGFPWAVYGTNGRLIESKEAVLVQESPFDILSALLLNDYLTQFVV